MTYTIIDPTTCDYGAIGDGVTDDYAPVMAAIAASFATGNEIRLPPKNFRLHMTQRQVLDFTSIASKGFKMTGSGMGRTRFTITTDLPGNVGGAALWQWSAASDWYFVTLADFMICSVWDGKMFAFGKDDMSDPLNFLVAERVCFMNTKAGASTEALRLNFVVNSKLDSVIANCSSNVTTRAFYGSAIHIKRGQFVTHLNCSYGNAARGVLIDSDWTDTQYFINCDVENVCYAYTNNSLNAGLNEIHGGRISNWANYAFSAPQKRANENAFTIRGKPSYGPFANNQTIVDPTASAGIVFVP